MLQFTLEKREEVIDERRDSVIDVNIAQFERGIDADDPLDGRSLFRCAQQRDEPSRGKPAQIDLFAHLSHRRVTPVETLKPLGIGDLFQILRHRAVSFESDTINVEPFLMQMLAHFTYLARCCV